MTEPSTNAGMENAASKGSSGPKINGAVAPWLEKVRKLSVQTLERLHAASGTVFFPELNAKSEALFFRYRDGWKARAVPDKAFVASKGWKPSFWNLDAVLETLQGGPCDVYITEGELDVAALVEAGIPEYQIISVPSGTKSKDAGAPIPYVLDALEEGLGKASKFIWCGDMDDVGLALREQMANQFGIAKFWYVDWANGRKDANEVVMEDGLQSLMETLLAPKPWPTMGLFRLSELPEPPPLKLWTPSLECLANKVFFAPRTLSVVTGQPGHGKSMLLGQLWFEIIEREGIVGCFASFETMAKPHMRRQIRTLLNNKPEWTQTEEEKASADRWIEDHYLFLHHPEQRPTLGWFFDQSEVAVTRHGARIVQLDPWNRLEASKERNESETEYVARCLRAAAVFAKDMNCHVQIIAHPAKMEGNRRGSPPSLEDIAGSKAWEAMVDQGIIVHRPKLFDEVGKMVTKAKFMVRKARFEELGYPTSINIDYDMERKQYVPDYSSDLVEDP